MANGSYIQVSSGTGPKLATGPTYTENSNTVQDEKVILGEPYLASYQISATGVSWGTASAHVLQIMAGSSLRVKVHRLIVTSTGATAAGSIRLSVLRLTSAGTGGTAITPSPSDPADAASGATAMTLPSSKGTEGVALGSLIFGTVGAATPTEKVYYEWKAKEGTKPLVIAAGTSNGIVIKTSGGLTIIGDVWAEITESSF